MALKPLLRKYRMTDGDLLQTADHVKNCVVRDADDFLTRGVDSARVADLTDARNAFADHPTDIELEGLVTVATNSKNAKRGQLEYELKAIRSIADTEYKGVGLYKTFGFEGLTEALENDFVRQAKRIHRVATSLQTTLEPRGMTDDRLTLVNTLLGQFDNSIDGVDTAVENRDMQTQLRISLGNDLFDIIMELANIGKNLYEDTDEAKYNDYIINDSPNYDGPGTYAGTVAAASAKEVAHIVYNAGRLLTFTNTGGVALKYYLTGGGLAENGTVVTLAAGESHAPMAMSALDATANHIVVKNESSDTEGSYSVVVG